MHSFDLCIDLKLVLHDATFPATCLAVLEKEKPLRVEREMLHFAISGCNLQ